MTLSDRADAYNAAYAGFQASHLRVVREQDGAVLYGTWLIGNDYRNKSTYYGAYPRGYLPRVQALFPDVRPARVLHAFSGSLPAGDYSRCDSVQDAEIQCRVEELPQHESFLRFGPWELIFADPPYSSADAEQYNTAMIDRKRATAALAQVTRVGGFMVWLDTCWPMFRKAEWRTVGRIALIRSTNHRVRLVSIFERQVA